MGCKWHLIIKMSPLGDSIHWPNASALAAMTEFGYSWTSSIRHARTYFQSVEWSGFLLAKLTSRSSVVYDYVPGTLYLISSWIHELISWVLYIRGFSTRFCHNLLYCLHFLANVTNKRIKRPHHICILLIYTKLMIENIRSLFW